MKHILKNSMAAKLIAMYFASSFVVLASFALIVQYSVKHHFYEQDYQLLHSKFMAIASKLDDSQNNSTPPLAVSSAYLWILGQNDVQLYANSSLPLPKKLTTSLEWVANGKSYRAFRFNLQNSRYDSVVLALNIDHHTNFISGFNLVLFWTFLIASAISGVYAVLTVRKGLEPLQILQNYLGQVNTKRLDIRVPIKDLPVELSQLVETQNNMLDRLQRGFGRLSEFSSDIAHELRTPLTNMMTQTQVALSSTRAVSEYQEILSSNAEELERLNKTISDTLYLAKSENQLLHSNKEVLSLVEVIQPLIEFYELLAEDKNVCLELTGSGVQFGDKLMLQRAVSNIISNALRHCDPDTTISIAVLEDDLFNTIKIKNTGEPIPDDSLPYLFDRFYRADKSRRHIGSIGAGLGLAITKSIVQAHGGDITVFTSGRMSEFNLILKKDGNNN